ncbi:uncharacterized protein ColSpa_07088 [Colletotrichum spaethianum]|uniref:Uncharacterized protein n=1 Tax=Colletotrichum spaethianum TaxID=700344 RepID=A0AA37LE80_9PEZI|nr:uncharacterized protein ColSpa_07088 [Colletotrichum spaethianum]GKT46907.1 hypothetical protein ColSpa_07088 [Colletotrichum spaethianum]
MLFSTILSAAFVAAAVPMIDRSEAHEVEITNAFARTLTNYTLIYEFDIIDNKEGELAHCNGECYDLHALWLHLMTLIVIFEGMT